jgi:hypothetical protein
MPGGDTEAHLYSLSMLVPTPKCNDLGVVFHEVEVGQGAFCGVLLAEEAQRSPEFVDPAKNQREHSRSMCGSPFGPWESGRHGRGERKIGIIKRISCKNTTMHT